MNSEMSHPSEPEGAENAAESSSGPADLIRQEVAPDGSPAGQLGGLVRPMDGQDRPQETPATLDPGRVGDFTGLEGAPLSEILARIPEQAEKRILTPQVRDGVEYPWEGAEFKWAGKDEHGMEVIWRARMHSPDPIAPAGTKAAAHWTLRVERGLEIMDAAGIFHDREVAHPRGSRADENIINNTHIIMAEPSPAERALLLREGRKTGQ